MCGLAGLYAYHYAANPIDLAELRTIRDHMAARGPDGEGEWLSADGRIGFGHRRLAIIDLSDRAAQPMASADGKIVIVFNGEIYNYRALRSDLESKGYVFRTQSDTEVLLQLYASKGAAMVRDLRGMFAFGLWDADKQGLLLARDPYGIKPLYYADDGWTLRFASQVKALVAGRRTGLDPDPAGWAGFFLFGNVPEPYTIYRDIRAVPAGATLWIDRRGLHEPERYFSLPQVFAEAERPAARPDAQSRIRAALIDSVRHHLVADVPVGIFLSSGVDSAALLGLMRDAGHDDIHAITLRYEEFRDRHEDEAPLAGVVARHYGARHTIRTVTHEEFRADLPKIFTAMDQPTIDGINTWFVAKAARELGLKAAISGLGGDELVGGYPSFTDIPRWVRWGRLSACVPFAGEAFRRTVSAVNDLVPLAHPKIAGLSEICPLLCRRLSVAARRVHAVGIARLDGPQIHPRRFAAARPGQAHCVDPQARAAHGLGQSGGARVEPLSAQPAFARYRLGQHGALARSARAVRRCEPPASGGGGFRRPAAGCGQASARRRTARRRAGRDRQARQDRIFHADRALAEGRRAHPGLAAGAAAAAAKLPMGAALGLSGGAALKSQSMR